jgi:hypothetical protein
MVIFRMSILASNCINMLWTSSYSWFFRKLNFIIRILQYLNHIISYNYNILPYSNSTTACLKYPQIQQRQYQRNYMMFAIYNIDHYWINFSHATMYLYLTKILKLFESQSSLETFSICNTQKVSHVS